ncbi:MAG: hypothetical protein ERJ68_06805 [Aphanocapsa feldmannii 277cI]|uniref:Uncharacterized protein n=1 Tax=Aphanocapsa feldmannii 277cI TaxID=2507554 RepID=A0A524RSL9_9CHRO|nr:MAG: hypothetical protein ERJ69_05715 [Aphanocapsa feldmannii 288cV]TGH20463.1 MAG: hypothetical protein ERJ68_06805 [Aphanocapsa feldmannii 277cI]
MTVAPAWLAPAPGFATLIPPYSNAMAARRWLDPLARCVAATLRASSNWTGCRCEDGADAPGFSV